jgi:uncharacterized protein (DUF924 family)
VNQNQVRAIIDFWFSRGWDDWWKADEAFDAEIGKRFGRLWEEQREHVPEHFLGSADEALAAVILFDQFPRNMFRGHADQFSTDPLALTVAKGAVERGFDDEVPKERRIFFYMPFQHSETLEDQQRSLLLFTALGDDYHLGFAKKHHDVIARFGRFPHRNAILGRAARPEEIAAGEVVPW